MHKPDFPKSDQAPETLERVPSELFDTDDFPPEERLAAFRRLVGPLFDVWAQGPATEFDAKAFGQSVGPFVFTQVRFNSPARFLRSAAHCQGEGKDFLVMEIMRRGAQRVVMPQSHLRFHAGNIYLRDWSHEFDAYGTVMRLDSIVIPRDMLRASANLRADNPVLSWSVAEPDGHMLSQLWSSLLTEFGRASPAQAEALVMAFMKFLDGLLLFDGGEAPEATLGAMQQYLNARLRGKISTKELCDHFNVSRSTLYRLFESVGGVRHYITQTRLERCFTELLVADPDLVKVSDVATSWGFHEASTFTRSFRDRFDTTPSNVLGKAHALESDPAISQGVSNTAYCRNYLGWFEAASGLGKLAKET
ncbi:MAG: helix-turn-helix transcriptional regulator [Pseudomonadota bacterium]